MGGIYQATRLVNLVTGHDGNIGSSDVSGNNNANNGNLSVETIVEILVEIIIEMTVAVIILMWFSYGSSLLCKTSEGPL